MILLLDTHVLLWAAYDPDQLTQETEGLLEDRGNTLIFSAASIWEVSIKAGFGREDFSADPRVLRRSLLEVGYQELSITGAHTAAISDLPPLHKDPFDRLLVAQARSEGVALLTADTRLSAYGPPVRLV
ncbi:type II toxin-antitoxin system VapC family toxin [Microbacterium sp. A93]|uniref:type II toxin-antitoxin system VapC family toxin n=1 Tax=Microbacterium sp. A93 TaxID=3450716 RepID=UPI003F42B089